MLPNCSCQHEHEDVDLFNAVLVLGVLPVISTVGLIANVFSILIYSKHRQSASLYLTALSCSDLGVCLSGIFVISADSLRPHFSLIDQTFVLLLPKLIPFGLAFQMLSVYITVMAAIDCFLSVSRSYRDVKSWYCTMDNAHKVMFCLVFFVILYNLILFGELEAIKCFNLENGESMYELCPTEMRLNENYITIYRGYMYALIMAFLPFTFLLFLTVGILCAMNTRCAESNREIMARAVDSIEAKADDASSPIVLVMVVALFLLCNAISLLVNICDMIAGLITPDTQMALIDVGNVLVVFNATANFFIYITFSQSYRKDLCAMLRLKTTR
uniref:G_PROTEIN_RECEP_F1_2 domain-containing protein n=1 Tax=Steinernema glaseri TaxID=37863 RepID=A0A1I7YDS1_9BILA